MPLSDTQRAVAQNTADSILLLAGAGTGKTTTLAGRAGHLLSSGAAAPQEILCLSFTNRACRELRDRLTDGAAAAVEVRTMHGFCAELLRTAPAGLHDLPSGFCVCDQEDCLELIREVVCETIGRSIPPESARILQQFCSLVKDCRLEHPALSEAQAAAWLFAHRRAAVEKLCYDRKRRATDEKFLAFLAKYGGSLTRLYSRRLLSCGLLDFADLLLRADALLRDPQAAALLSGRYRFIHLDEAQDVSMAEYALVRRLCGSGTRLLLCGDFFQTIYEWRGSDPKRLIAAFRADFSPVEVSFTESYRAVGPLLDAARSFRAHAFGGEPPGTFDPRAPGCDAVVFGELETPAEEADWICRQLAALEVKELSRVAVITRTNRACAEICDQLARAAQESSPGQPPRFMLAEEARLFSRAAVRDLTACLSLLANPRDDASLSRVLSRLTPGAGSAARAALAAGVTSGGLPADLLDLRTRRTGDFFAPLIDALDGGRVVVFDVESTGTDVFSDEIIQIAAARLAPDGGDPTRFERFLKNTRPVGSSERVHGFSDEYLSMHGIDPLQALGEFLDFAQGCVIVGHNVTYDLSITAQNLLLRGSDRLFAPVFYDTLDLARRFLPALPNHKLLTVSAALETAHTPSHDAMDDILATADVLTLLADRFILPQTAPRRAFYRAHLPRLAPLADTLAWLHTAPFPDLPALCRAAADTFQIWKQCDSHAAHHAVELFFELAGELSDRSLPLPRQLHALLELTRLAPGELARLSRSFQKVSVITAHQAKGCEFDYVFLPMLQEGVCPLFGRRGQDGGEEARIFYVSLTRARARVFLSWSHENAQHRTAAPSRFLRMLGPAAL